MYISSRSNPNKIAELFFKSKQTRSFKGTNKKEQRSYKIESRLRYIIESVQSSRKYKKVPKEGAIIQ